MRIAVAVAVLAGISLVGAPYPAVCADDDEAKWQQVENTAKARQFYTAGEAANKKGDLKTAVKCWAAVLELKPDSDHTRKCLAQAREKLYKRYIDYAAKHSAAKDPLTSYLVLEDHIALLPDKTDLPTRLEKIKPLMTPDHTKALELYRQVLRHVSKSDYTAAKEVLASLQSLPIQAACIDELARVVNKPVPKLLYIATTWCPACKQSRPIVEQMKSEYLGKVEIVFADCDKDKAIGDRYNVTRVPTLVLLDRSGRKVGRWVGFPGRDALVRGFGKLGVK